jgi:mevalonate kinase
MGIAGHANGKLLLFGEHAAVYGHTAVGMALADRTTVTFEGPAVTEWNLESVPREDRDAVRGALARVEEKLPGLAAKGRCAVHIKSSVPRKAGFGSSAALCGALARAALGRAGEDGADLSRAWAIAHDAEKLFHGTPSGVDTGLSLIGGTCILRPRPPGLPEHRLIPPTGMTIVVGAVHRDEGCAALVSGLAARMRSGDRTVGTAINALGELSMFAALVLRSWEKDSPAYLGALADAAMARLRDLGLSTPELEVALEAARGAGALGAKLSGAGGGGAFYAVAPDAAAAAVISRKIEEAAASRGIALLSPPRVVTA